MPIGKFGKLYSQNHEGLNFWTQSRKIEMELRAGVVATV